MGINQVLPNDEETVQNTGNRPDANHPKKPGNERRGGNNSGHRMPKEQSNTQGQASASLGGAGSQKQADALGAFTESQPSQTQAKDAQQQLPKEKKKKNVFGLDFEIPDELSELIAKEMKQQTEAGGKPNNPL